MQAFIPQPLRVNTLPPSSGWYLTNLGELYYDKETTSFKMEKTSTYDLNISVSRWYKQVTVLSEQEYAKACADGRPAHNQTYIFTH